MKEIMDHFLHIWVKAAGFYGICTTETLLALNIDRVQLLVHGVSAPIMLRQFHASPGSSNVYSLHEVWTHAANCSTVVDVE
jgi:hypothetical protein